MTHESERSRAGVSRRKFIVTSGAIGAAGLAGCTGSQDGGAGSGDGSSGSTDVPESTPTEASSGGGDGGSGSETSLLTAEGSSTVYSISNKGSSWSTAPRRTRGVRR